MNQHAKEALINIGSVFAILTLGLFVVAMGFLAAKGELFGPPADESFEKGQSKFEIAVGQGGESVYSGLENVSEEVRERVEGKTYPSPEAAEEATADLVTQPTPTYLPDRVKQGFQYFGIQPAEAHAVKVCTHSTSGVTTNNTGTSKHVTWFQGHWNGAHHTRTVHRVLSGGYWVTVATYDYAVTRAYCGC